MWHVNKPRKRNKMYNNHNTFLPASKFDCNCHFKKMQGVKKNKPPANVCKKMCGKVAGVAFVCLLVLGMIWMASIIIALAHLPPDDGTLAPVVTPNPTMRPTTLFPSSHPTTSRPSKVPSKTPSKTPSKVPSRAPTRSPTPPTLAPTKSPTTPTIFVPAAITTDPTTSPTAFPTTAAPTTAQPSKQPSRTPSWSPSQQPSRSPSKQPTTSLPSLSPSRSPSKQPVSSGPSLTPSRTPSNQPSMTPSLQPTPPTPAPTTLAPTTVAPTKAPTGAPTPATTVNILFGAPTASAVDGGYTNTAAQTACNTAAPSVPGIKVSTCTSVSPFAAKTVSSVDTYQWQLLSANPVFGRDGTQIATSESTFYNNALMNSLSAAGVCSTTYWSFSAADGSARWNCFNLAQTNSWAAATGGSNSNAPQGGNVGSCTSTTAGQVASPYGSSGVSCSELHEVVCICQGLTLF